MEGGDLPLMSVSRECCVMSISGVWETAYVRVKFASKGPDEEGDRRWTAIGEGGERESGSDSWRLAIRKSEGVKDVLGEGKTVRVVTPPSSVCILYRY